MRTLNLIMINGELRDSINATGITDCYKATVLFSPSLRDTLIHFYTSSVHKMGRAECKSNGVKVTCGSLTCMNYDIPRIKQSLITRCEEM
jgi:hypothetical protein